VQLHTQVRKHGSRSVLGFPRSAGPSFALSHLHAECVWKYHNPRPEVMLADVFLVQCRIDTTCKNGWSARKSVSIDVMFQLICFDRKRCSEEIEVNLLSVVMTLSLSTTSILHSARNLPRPYSFHIEWLTLSLSIKHVCAHTVTQFSVRRANLAEMLGNLCTESHSWEKKTCVKKHSRACICLCMRYGLCIP
jgi:hypothetical protein